MFQIVRVCPTLSNPFHHLTYLPPPLFYKKIFLDEDFKVLVSNKFQLYNMLLTVVTCYTLDLSPYSLFLPTSFGGAFSPTTPYFPHLPALGNHILLCKFDFFLDCIYKWQLCNVCLSLSGLLHVS